MRNTRSLHCTVQLISFAMLSGISGQWLEDGKTTTTLGYGNGRSFDFFYSAANGKVKRKAANSVDDQVNWQLRYLLSKIYASRSTLSSRALTRSTSLPVNFILRPTGATTWPCLPPAPKPTSSTRYTTTPTLLMWSPTLPASGPSPDQPATVCAPSSLRW